MQTPNDITYVGRADVDDDLWDRCITSATNGLIYGYTFYLDAMADDWGALIYKNYEAVLPLPWRKKWGIYYLYQPFLTAQLGVFGIGLTSDIVEALLQAIPKKFSYWEVSLNHQNVLPATVLPLYSRSNFILSLRPSYKEIYKGYRENIRRNIKKNSQYKNSIVNNVNIKEIISLTKMQAAEISQNDFDRFTRLFHFLQQRGAAKTYGIVSAANELLASCVLFFSHKRAYYILVGNHPNGRTLGASHALIDAIIKDHAGQDLWLDFEGSDIRNLAFFYSSFGAKEEPYAAIKLNRLPWWAKWLKR